MTAKFLRGAAALSLLLSTGAQAAPVTVTGAWFRALPGGLPAGGYFTLHNGTARTVTLHGARSPACGMLMLHKSDSMGGMAGMSDVAGIDVAAGASLAFAPGGYHLMCMDPSPAMRAGDKVGVTLDFADGATLKTPFAVRGANGR